MHVSLDSALGRQRRLNSVGESVLQIAPNAAAAYSLRSLTGGDPKVVRVRRASDNGERDFTSSEIATGEMVNWVNRQVIAPLDIQALEADGRTGDFLIAKAAYSLRSLGTRQATLAATGDTVARADGKYVVQVRRSSDDALKSFTADEVTDGTLLAFVNPTYTVGTSVESVSRPFDSFTSNGNDGFTATNNTTGSATAGFPYTFATGDVISVSFDLLIADNASPTFILNGSDMGSGNLGLGTTFTSSGSYTQELTTASGTGTHLAFTDGNTGTFTISNFKVTSHKADGFVKTWYDQSVTNQAGDTATGNHAVQATAANQPKIVSAGSLLTAGVTFDGGDSLSVSGEPVITASSSGVYSAFSVQTVATTSEAGYLYGNASSSNGSSLYADTSTFTLSNTNAATLDNISRSSGQNLLSAVYNNGDAGLLVNGAGTMTDTGTYNFSAGSSDFIIGNRNEGTVAATFLTGSINEIVIYNSNQTDNRGAIEANIGEAYSITGIPAYDDEVDGFVETWYDQSGNGNDAVQATAGNQPKIVNAGTLLNELDFDGTADELTIDFGADLSQANSFFMVHQSDTTTANSNDFFDRVSGSPRTLFDQSGNNYRMFSDSSADTGVAITTDKSLVFALYNGASSLFAKNGTATSALNVGTAGVNQNSSLGASNVSFYDGTIQEFIIYNSDQSSNRVAVETNINNQYSIF